MSRMARPILLILAACALIPRLASADTAAPAKKPPEVTTRQPLDLTKMSPAQLAKWSQLAPARPPAVPVAPAKEKAASFGTALTPEQSGLDRGVLEARRKAKLESMNSAAARAVRATGPVIVPVKPGTPRAPAAVPAPAAPLTPAERAKAEQARSAAAKGGAR